jgi:serine/threonine protein kinase, bacterial
VTAGGVVTTLAGSSGQAGSSDGSGSGALFLYPYAVAVDASGNVYVADSGNNNIRKGHGGRKREHAGRRRGLRGKRGRCGRRGALQHAAGDSRGRRGQRLRERHQQQHDPQDHAAGVVTTLAGVPGQTGSSDGTGASARFYNPFGLAVDSSGQHLRGRL